MGLKGVRLWVMGQLDSNVQSPTEVFAASAAAAVGFRLSIGRERRPAPRILSL